MRLKLALQRPGGAPVDLSVTIEASTTVGQLADYLAAADPNGRRAAAGTGHTLGLVGAHTLALDVRQLVSESDLRSGQVVSISRPGERFADPHRSPAAVVRVLAGPNSGQEYQLPRGQAVIGRERGCDVRLTDDLVSRRHARLNIGDTVEIVDLGSANGVLLDGQAVPRSLLRMTDVVQLGDTTLSVRLLPHAGTPAAASAVGFVRSPRLDPYYEGRTFTAPEPPERPRPQRFPIAPLLAPIVMGVLLYYITKSVASLAFIALSPIMLIGNAVESRISARADYQRSVAEFRADLQALGEALGGATAEEVEARDGELPATGACLAAVGELSPLVWTRQPDIPGFGRLRLGVGTLPSRHTVELPVVKRTTRGLRQEIQQAIEPFAEVGPVPVAALLDESAVGLAGPRAALLPVARAMLGQLMSLHSPAELVITGFASSQSARDWDWLKWAPHTSSPHSPVDCRLLSATGAGGTALVSALEELLAERSAEQRPADRRVLPAVAVLVEDDAPAERSRLVALAERGPTVGIYVVWLAGEVAALPAACRTFLDVGRAGVEGLAGYVHTGRAVTPVQLDRLSEQEAMTLVRQLSPLVDLGARVDDDSDLPRSVSLLSLNGVELGQSPTAIIERWNQNRSILTGPAAPTDRRPTAGTLRAVIGESAGGPFALDLRTDGPHALVGGTTGSGKSELLQAWILGMAIAHSPQRLNFLLVDYKGGSAFRDCVALPHTVGLVTDLSQHMVRRALTSLKAELEFREHELARHSAKDLIALENRGISDAPPSLVIVVDEFAALLADVPEFINGMVNVAQRGRSLGLHLILATQQPAGVIKDNLRANTNLRLALRMADEADSIDVLGTAQAAFFDPAVPGRAAAKTGPGRLRSFQAGYAGGWTTDEPPPPEILVEELTFGAGPTWVVPATELTVPGNPGQTDIQRLVATVVAANAEAEIAKPRKPWLPVLLPVYDLGDREQVPFGRSDTALVFAIRDDPKNQKQPVVVFDPDRDGNLAVFGTSGSGKSTLLRTLAIAAGFTVKGGPCHVYGLDFAGRSLDVLEKMPHVGSVIAGADHERVERLLSMLRSTVDSRLQRYAERSAATITEYRLLTGIDEPRILVLLDGIAAFRNLYEVGDRSRYFDMLVSIAADGRQAGVHLVLSGDRAAAMPSALGAAVQRRVVLRLADAQEYSTMGVPSDVLSPASPPGRGLLDENEIQIAMLCKSVSVVDPETGETRIEKRSDASSQAEAIASFARSMRQRAVGVAAEPIGKLTAEIFLRELPVAVDGQPAVGMSGETLAPIGFAPRGSFLISGPPGSGRTSTLLTLRQSLRRWRPDMPMYYFGDRRSPLAELTGWTDSATSQPLVAELAGKLAITFETSAMDTQAAVFVEGLAEFINGEADAKLQELCRRALAAGAFLVMEGETTTLSSNYGLLGYGKSSRAGIALQPESAEGTTAFRTNFPARLNRADFPVGRGLLVTGGRTTLVQVAAPD